MIGPKMGYLATESLERYDANKTNTYENVSYQLTWFDTTIDGAPNLSASLYT